MLEMKGIYRSEIGENLTMYVQYLVKVNFKVLMDGNRICFVMVTLGIHEFSTLAHTGIFLSSMVNKAISYNNEESAVSRMRGL